MRYLISITIIFCYSLCISAQNQPSSHPEYAGVKKAMLNYVEALYEVDTNKIISSVHPSLRKIGYWYNPDKKEYMDNLNMSFDQLVNLTARWNASGNNANEKSRKEVVIYEVNDRTASGKVEAVWGIDYMHMVNLDGRWMIMNIVWQSHPEEAN